MRIRKSPLDKAFCLSNVVFMCFMVVVMIIPMLHVLNISLSSAVETDKGGIFLYPRDISTLSYQAIFSEKNILLSYGNTVAYTLGRTFCTLLFSSMIAYTISLQEFILKRFITIMLTITMFISGGLVPSYLVVRQFGLYNTYWAMVLPGCVGCYNVILFRTFFKANAMTLREAAIIDGAGEFYTFIRIVTPLSTAIFATLGLFTAVATWNSWFDALIYLRDDTKYPYQMILQRVLDSVDTTLQKGDMVLQELYRKNKYNARNVQMAAIVVGMVPILCVYPFIQKYFVKGMFVGSLKE